MTFRTRIRLLLPVLAVASVVSFGRRAAAGCHHRPERATRPDHSGRSADHGRHAAERAALLHPREQAAAGARRAPARRQRGLGARRRRPARARALRRAHELQRHAAFPEAGRRQLHAVARHAVRRARERAYRASTKPCTSCRFPTDNPAVIDRSLLILEDWAHNVSFDAGGDRQGARRHPRGMAARAGRRRADSGRAVSPPAQGLALRRAASDRQAGDHPERQSRSAEAVLRRLVPARPDGGRRRRRFRQVRDRSADQIALRLDPGRARLRSRGRRTPCRINPGRPIR